MFTCYIRPLFVKIIYSSEITNVGGMQVSGSLSIIAIVSYLLKLIIALVQFYHAYNAAIPTKRKYMYATALKY